jgi:hypothetical protein
MKTKKKNNHKNTRVKRGGGGGLGGLHQLIKGEKQLYGLLQVSGLTPPDERKTSVVLDQVLHILETRMLFLKKHNDIHGFQYIDKRLRGCIPHEDEPNKRMSPSIHNILRCFGNGSPFGYQQFNVPMIEAGFVAEKQLHKLIKDFIAEIKRLGFNSVMQYEFELFGGSYTLGNLLFATMDRIHVTHDLRSVPAERTEKLREIASDAGTAVRAIMDGVRSQIELLHAIKTVAIPAMEKTYRDKDTDEWAHITWETIPAFLHPDGDEAEFAQHMERFKTKIDVAIAQKRNAIDARVGFADPLNLTHLRHRSAPRAYAKGVLQPARPPMRAIGQIVADIASYSPDISRKQMLSQGKDMSQMRGMRDLLIHMMASSPQGHSFQGPFYKRPEN